MSIHFISGKPGGGKSLYAVRLIVDELVKGDRVVITNVALKLGALNEYLQREYPSKLIDLHNRVMLLPDEDVGRFWLIRPGWYRLQDVSEMDQRGGKRLDWSHCFAPDGSGEYKSAHEIGGVMYAIDEIHNFFNAREWMHTGKSALFYLSQHRKLGDDVLCITQSVNNVDKQFRSVAQDFSYMRNHSKERLGVFRSINRFTRKTYASPVTGSPGEHAMEHALFKLDVEGLASCYDTAAGVGILGRSADVGARKKGIPFSMLVLAGVLAFVCLAMLPKGVRAGLLAVSKPSSAGVAHTAISNEVERVASLQSSHVSETLPPVATAVPELRRAVIPPAPLASSPGAPAPDLELVGVVGGMKYGRAMFSDGSVVRVGDARLTHLSPDLVVVDGKQYRLKASKTASSTQGFPIVR